MRDRFFKTLKRSTFPARTQRSMSHESLASKEKYIFTGGDREQYTKGQLEIDEIDPNSPFPTFHRWFQQAKSEGITADAVCLSTAELPTGRVSSRMVLLKELDQTGFVIYSNFGTSRKSKDLESNKHASMCFWYEKMERSVRVEGITERLTDSESQVYFNTRPVGSRIGAWASPQSSVISDRAELDAHVESFKNKFGITEDTKDADIPVPSYWGGLRIIPYRVEFWSGRNNRLHDRFAMSRHLDSTDNTHQDSAWRIERLAP